jgi:hypothetical protein
VSIEAVDGKGGGRGRTRWTDALEVISGKSEKEDLHDTDVDSPRLDVRGDLGRGKIPDGSIELANSRVGVRWVALGRQIDLSATYHTMSIRR